MKHKKQLKKKSEIRLHNVELKNRNNQLINIMHPAYIFLENNQVFIYVTLTHSDKVRELLTIRLKRNPNPNDRKDAYWVAEIRSDKKENFTKIKKKMEIR